MTALSIEGVIKAFGATEVLKGVTLEVPTSGFTAILGPSGCGKTTLLRLVAGFADPDSGVIRFGDDTVFRPGFSMSPQRRRVGYVPQEGALFPHLDVASNITFGLPRAERKASKRIDELLELVGLDPDKKRRYPNQLSGGQQQRVALARALAPNPPVVLLDEPFASLDAGLREGTGRAVASALRASGTTAVLVTHDQDEALSLADQVAVMREGRLVQVGTPKDVYALPLDAGVASFVGAAVILPVVISDGRAQSALGALEVSSPGAVQGTGTILVRPEQICLMDQSAPAGVEARVTEVSYYGHDASVRLALLSTGDRITARVLGVEAPMPETIVRVAVQGPVMAFGVPATS